MTRHGTDDLVSVNEGRHGGRVRHRSDKLKSGDTWENSNRKSSLRTLIVGHLNNPGSTEYTDNDGDTSRRLLPPP